MTFETSRRMGGRAFILGLVALQALTLVSFGLSYLDAGGLVLGLALAVAGVQVLIIAMIFMHLYESRFGVQFMALITLVWIALLCLGMVADVGLR
jgi:caa(3)-type oxidase subunit IV